MERSLKRKRTLPSSSEASDKSKVHNCAICLESIQSSYRKARTLPCNHDNFDYECLSTWLAGLVEGKETATPTCPICRTEVTSINYNFVSTTVFETLHCTRRYNRGRDVAFNEVATLYHYSSRCRRRRPRALPIPERDSALLRRKHIYRYKLFSLHVGANSLSGHRGITAHLFNTAPDLQSRARKWMRRELAVFDFLNPNDDDATKAEHKQPSRFRNAEYLMEYVIAILKLADIKGADGQAEDLVTEFLGRDNTRLFLHELEAWLRSPYTDLAEWDRSVQYNEEIAYQVEDSVEEQPRKKASFSGTQDSVTLSGRDKNPLRQNHRFDR